MIFICSVAYGIYLSYMQTVRREKANKSVEMLYELRNILRFSQPDADEIISRLKKSGYGDFFENSENKESRSKLKTVIDEYWSHFGTHDLKGELDSLKLCIESSEKERDAIICDANNKSKLYVGLGILAGTFAVIMLI